MHRISACMQNWNVEAKKMPYLMAICTYSQDLSAAVVDAFASTHVDCPDSVKKVIDLFPIAHDVYENWVLYEFSGENFMEALAFVSKRFDKVAAAVKGFKFKLIPMASDSEAVQMMQ